MADQVTITVSTEVYRGLQTVAGSRTISEFLEDLARPLVSEAHLEGAYRDMALDDGREREANEWAEGLAHDSWADDGDAAR